MIPILKFKGNAVGYLTQIQCYFILAYHNTTSGTKLLCAIELLQISVLVLIGFIQASLSKIQGLFKDF